MNILHLVTAYRRNRYDIITPWLVDMLNEQSKKHNVTVLTSGYKRTPQEQKDGQIEVSRFNYCPSNMQRMSHDMTINDFLKRHKHYYFILPIFFLMGMLKLIKLSISRQIDIITIHWPFPMALMYLPVKNLIHAKTVNVWYGAEMKILSDRTGLLSNIFRYIAKQADYNVVISSHTEKLLDDIAGAVKTEIIPYGVHIKPFRKFDKEQYILFAGRLVERKGVQYLIDAMQYVNSEYKLIIAGDGPLKENLQRHIAQQGLTDRVKMTGYVSDERLQELYEHASVFVLPAIYDRKGDTEGLGMVLVEAICKGTPVIATGIGGIRDIVIDKETGLFSKEKDSRDIAEKVSILIKNEELKNKIVKKAYEHVTMYFSIERISGKFNEIYKNIV